MSCIPKLPFDIFYVIIAQLPDYKTLSAFSLTSSRLRSMAQERIFRKTTITVGNITPGSEHANGILELTRFLTSNSHIARSIHSLTVRIIEGFNGASSISHWPPSSSLLRAFPNVRDLYIVDVSRSRYRGWWNMNGDFPDALRSLVQQTSVTMMQLGAPGMEREFEWPTILEGCVSADGHCRKRFPSFSVDTAARGLRVLRAASFRDRPDNVNTIQDILVRSGTTLTHAWLAFPTHSLPYNLDRPALSLHALVNLKCLMLSFNADTLIPPVLRILDTISTEVHGALDLVIRMRRCSSWILSSLMTREYWIEMDHKLADMLDRQILRSVELEITVFEMGDELESAINVITDMLPGIHRLNCVIFKKK
ncbi:hypothetical protein C0995_004872 [Termitomyces sp. Mi166|nr:hypothetical protein C0995_004872 [Termitomyces sp. Mi166\